MTAAARLLDWGGETARTCPWHGDPGIAYLSPLGNRSLTVRFVLRCLGQLAGEGYRAVLTGALTPLEQVPFLGAGFDVAEELCVLVRDLKEPQPSGSPATVKRSTPTLRRGRRGDRGIVQAVDREAFPPFWRLGPLGLDEALGATPRARFRVAEKNPGQWDRSVPRPVLAYAVTGIRRRQGFLQRLAVLPGEQGAGVGTSLVLDSMSWLRRWHVAQAFVNTHPSNAGALSLYEGLGFRRQPAGLAVLAADLGE